METVNVKPDAQSEPAALVNFESSGKPIVELSTEELRHVAGGIDLQGGTQVTLK